MRRYVFCFVALVASDTLALQRPDCNVDIDACVRLAIAETATFMEECGKVHPETKVHLDAALLNWSVLKLPIPKLEEALNPKSEVRMALSDIIDPYLKRIPPHEQDIECSGRVEWMRSKEPMLGAGSVQLPKNTLRKYAK